MNTILFYTVLLIILLRISVAAALLLYLYMLLYVIPSESRARRREHFATQDPSYLTSLPAFGNSPQIGAELLIRNCNDISLRNSPTFDSFDSFVSSKLVWVNKGNDSNDKTPEQAQIQKYLYGYITGTYDTAIESIYELLLSFYPLKNPTMNTSTPAEETRRSDIRAKCERFYRYLIFPRLLKHRSYKYDTTVEKPYQIKTGIRADPVGNKQDDAIYYRRRQDLRRDGHFTIYQRIITDSALSSSVYPVTFEIKKAEDIEPTDYRLCDPIRDVDTGYKGALFKDDANAGIGYHPKSDGELFDFMNRFVFTPVTTDTESNRKKMKAIKCMFIDGKYSSYIDDVLNLVWTIRKYLYDNRIGEEDDIYKEYCRILVDVYSLSEYRFGNARKRLNCDAM